MIERLVILTLQIGSLPRRVTIVHNKHIDDKSYSFRFQTLLRKTSFSPRKFFNRKLTINVTVK